MSKKRFIYHGYLQIAELDAAATESAMPVLRKNYLWDPLEPAATRILAKMCIRDRATMGRSVSLRRLETTSITRVVCPVAASMNRASAPAEIRALARSR